MQFRILIILVESSHALYVVEMAESVHELPTYLQLRDIYVNATTRKTLYTENRFMSFLLRNAIQKDDVKHVADANSEMRFVKRYWTMALRKLTSE